MKDDAISRQAAIETTWEEPSFTDPFNVLTEVRDRLKALPSAQPEITDEQAIEHLQSTGWMQSHDRILTQSTWDIIRCKDCKHWKDSDGIYRRGVDAESKCPVNIQDVYDGIFYCGYAERKTDGTD